MKLISFDDALKASKGNRHLFLGNGFSRALRNDIFAYDALFAQADFSGMSANARQAFDVLRTTDFELVMRALRDAEKLVALYAAEVPDAAAAMAQDAARLRDLLAATIAKNHPDRPHDVSNDAYRACKKFLSRFNGKIYSLNYDLLLYWALMQTEIEPAVESDDGFRQPEEGPAEYVTWDPAGTDDQRIFYLHGALHLFDAGGTLNKMTWKNTGLALVDQIRTALAGGLFPVFVSEGTTEEKKAKIMHSAYLGRGLRSFPNITGTLFTFGFAMSPNDEHWLRLIEKGRLTLLAVGLYGDPEAPWNKAISSRAEAIKAAKRGKPIEVIYYQAESAAVWG
jgi:hypothetical protein